MAIRLSTWKILRDLTLVIHNLVIIESKHKHKFSVFDKQHIYYMTL